MGEEESAIAISVDDAGGIGATGISIDGTIVSGVNDPDGDDGRDVTLALHLEIIALKYPGDTCLSGNSSAGLDSESFEHKKGETAGNSGVVGRSVGISRIIGTSVGIVSKRITHETTDATLSSDMSKEIVVTEEVVQQLEHEVRKSKRNRTPKNFGPEFQLYLIKGTRDGVFNQYSYCFNVEDDPKTFDGAMKS
ncbi:hypothetical protein Tco_0000791 [Tanacetum coccineum]